MKTLIFNPFGLGDVLFSLPLVRALRQSDPNGFLGYISNQRTIDLVRSWPELNWTLVYEKDQIREDWRKSKRQGVQAVLNLTQQIRAQSFDRMVDLSMNWHASLIAWHCAIPVRAGFNFRNRGKFLTQKLFLSGFENKRVAEYYLDLLQPIGVKRPDKPCETLEISASLTEQAARYLHSLGLNDSQPVLGIVPGGGASWGAYASYKQWDSGRFARLAEMVAREKGAQVLLIGDATEEALCRKVADQIQPVPKLAIQVPTLMLLAAVLKRCALVIGNDSGPMHLARAVGSRAVTLFGPVDGSVYGPDLRDRHQRVASKALACRPCYRKFKMPPCPWDNRCLKELSIDEVLQEVRSLA